MTSTFPTLLRRENPHRSEPASFVGDSFAFAGHDAAHTSDEGLERVTDPVVFAACINQNRILVTGDKKLTKFLAASGALAPTVIIVRRFGGPIDEVAHALIANLPLVEETIQDHGNAVFSMGPDRPTRVQLLPLGGSW